MAESSRRLPDLTLTYDQAAPGPSTLDHAYAQSEREGRWRRALEDPEINPQGMGAAPPEAPGGPGSGGARRARATGDR